MSLDEACGYLAAKGVQMVEIGCGGCPGKRAVHRAKKMVKMGAEAIVFTSCISKGTPIGFPCPHYEMMIEAVRKAVGPDIPVYDHSH